MSNFKPYFLSFLQVPIFVLSIFTDWYLPLTIALLAILLYMVLDKLGKGIVLREMIAFHTCFVCLAMPLVGYAYYTQSDAVAYSWFRYMMVPEDVYFSFNMPAVTGFIFAMCFPIQANIRDEGAPLHNLILRIKEILRESQLRKKSIYLILFGLVMLFISDYAPAEVQFISLLFYFSAFAGILYVYYSPPFAYKIPILTLFVVFIVANALRSGMFTVLAYMGITMFSFVFLGTRMSLWKKALIFLTCVFALVLIQSVKPTFRQKTWTNKETDDSNAEIFVDLLSNQLSGGGTALFSKKSFFWIYYRTNQGFNIALVMRRIPSVQPFDGGENLAVAAASSIVPRFLWPDKPEAGGKFNMKYYAGRTIKGWSTNIGPLGEAYGSFGPTGGIIFMIGLGLFIRWSLKLVFVKAVKIPLLICWLPVLFYQTTYSAETDTLQVLNSLIKSAFFIWFLYKLFPALFGKRKATSEKPVPHRFQLEN